MTTKILQGYYFITDARLSRKGNVSDVKSALAAKVKIIQYRNKGGSAKEMFEEAFCLRELCRKVTFLINDRVDIALAVGADGVHLGQDDLSYRSARKLLGKNKIIGLTVHNLKEAQEAERLGANYISVAPIFKTKTKPDAKEPIGIEMLRTIRKCISIPLIAIGGITLENAKGVICAGADGVCAISAVLTAPSVKGEIDKFQKLF